MKHRSLREDLATRVVTGTWFGAICLFMLFVLPPVYFACLLSFFLLVILIQEWPRLFSPRDPRFWIIMPFYPVLPFVLLIALNLYSQYLLTVMFSLVAIHDSGCYLIGSLWGKHKMLPRVSPKKSWEGAAGGYAVTVLAIIILAWSQGLPIHLLRSMLLALVVALLAASGDMFESYLKRRVGLKDVANTLPGHGGLLDRFDACMFVVFFFYTFRAWLLSIF